jgi:hypothetical protein
MTTHTQQHSTNYSRIVKHGKNNNLVQGIVQTKEAIKMHHLINADNWND